MKPTSLSDGRAPHICCLINAIPGTGKTALVGTGDKILIIRPPQDHTHSIRDTSGVEEIVVRTWDDMHDAKRFCMNNGHKYRWVWFDSISLAQDQLLDTLWAKRVDDNPKFKGLQPDIQTYGINMANLATWVREMAGMGTFHFGVTAHPFWGKNLDDDEILMPYVQGKAMPEKVCGSMNMVGYMHVKKIKRKGESKATEHRVIEFNVSDRYYAKDQFDAFPNGRLVDPTLPAIEKAVKAARARDAAATPKKKTTTKGRTTTGRKAK